MCQLVLDRLSRLLRAIAPTCPGRPLFLISIQKLTDVRWFSTKIPVTADTSAIFECVCLLDTSELGWRPRMLNWLAKRHRVARFASVRIENQLVWLWSASLSYLQEQIIPFPEDFGACSSIAEKIMINFLTKQEQQKRTIQMFSTKKRNTWWTSSWLLNRQTSVSKRRWARRKVLHYCECIENST